MNLLAVILVTIIGQVLGGLWYGPLFGKVWLRLCGIKQKDIEKMKKDPKVQKAMKRSYIISFFATLVLTFILAFLIEELSVTNWIEGAFAGFIIWLGFIVPTTLNSVLWEKKPFEMWLLNVLHYFFAFIIAGAILAAW